MVSVAYKKLLFRVRVKTDRGLCLCGLINMSQNGRVPNRCKTETELIGHIKNVVACPVVLQFLT